MDGGAGWGGGVCLGSYLEGLCLWGKLLCRGMSELRGVLVIKVCLGVLVKSGGCRHVCGVRVGGAMHSLTFP